MKQAGFEQSVPVTGSKELEVIMGQQTVELGWWQDMPVMETRDDIDRQVESGQAVAVPAVGPGYRLSEKSPADLHVLDRRAFTLLQRIASVWSSRLPAQDEDLFLVITSLARTKEYQQELQDRGYPAADDSTHTRLAAFDIGVRWLQENNPVAYQSLLDVLREVTEAGAANIINEPTIGALHVCVHPDFETH